MIIFGQIVPGGGRWSASHATGILDSWFQMQVTSAKITFIRFIFTVTYKILGSKTTYYNQLEYIYDL